MVPKFFKTPLDFRKWLEKNHLKEKELIVGFYRVGSGKKSITWPESVEQALCFGWIDSVRKSIDDESYTIRFTPRKPTSIWSRVNLKKMEELKVKNLLFPAGIAAHEKRTAAKSEIYAYENEAVEFSPAFEKIFRKNKTAWIHFNAKAPSYKKTVKRWVMSAKQEVTRMKRLEQLIADSSDGKNIKAMNYSGKAIGNRQ